MNFDFEQYWRQKLINAIQKHANPPLSQPLQKCLQESETVCDSSSPTAKINWSHQAVSELEKTQGSEITQAIMLSCACHYPVEQLEPMRDIYAQTGDIEKAHRILQEQFIDFLRNNLKLSETTIEHILENGWGAAGILKSDRIIATKIPKSGNLMAYLETTDPDQKRALYCHCPRVRQLFADGNKLHPLYCYCSAGFYKAIWEEILQQPIRVELAKSLLKGDEVCQVVIYLPKK